MVEQAFRSARFLVRLQIWTPKGKRVGAEVACVAHNHKVGGSKPPPAKFKSIL